MQQYDHTHIKKQPLTFATIIIFGVAALLLGLALIIFAHYHERAYVFLGLGTGGIIGGIAGLVEAGPRTRTALIYGIIALGMMGIIVGLNYLLDRYGPGPNQAHGTIVIALSLIAILSGIVGALMAEPRGSMASLSSVMLLGVIASLGVVAMTVGIIYLVVLQSQQHAYLLFGIGAMCFIGGLACGIFVQSKLRAPVR